jgi:hypothetical protein
MTEYILRSDREAAERRRRNWVLICAAILIFFAGMICQSLWGAL